MKTVLIIYPHWVPANLAGVQRPRLIGNFITEFGYKPLLLTVDSHYYEESLDFLMEKTVSDDFEVVYTKAFPITKPRILGDIGIRAFKFLKNEALRLCKERPIDFIWIPIPSFYTSLLGRILHDKTKIPYGIDYIDPWVRDITNQNNLRAKLSQVVAKVLEPYAIKKAALISGVSTAYYAPVIKRNFKMEPVHVGMPYGFDPKDHEIQIDNLKLPWSDQPDCKAWIYAGAFLPNSHLFIEGLFKSVAHLKKIKGWDEHIRLYFIGTGPYPAKRITSYAKDYGLEDIVFEQRERAPFLHVLNFLSKADRVMLLGSTQKHYTASKTFQCLLSKKPLFAMLHAESSAVDILNESRASRFLWRYKEDDDLDKIAQELVAILIDFQSEFTWSINLLNLDDYSAKKSAKALASAIDKVLARNKITLKS